MKTFIICSATLILLSFNSTAQSTSPVNSETKAGMKDLRQDKIDLAKDHREFKNDLKTGDKTSAKAKAKEMRSDRKEIHQDIATLKGEGVKHPNQRANPQFIRAHKKRNG